MPIDFNQYLTDEQKRAILAQRLAQFAAEGWQHSLNAKIAGQSGDIALVQASEQAIATIEAAIAIHEAELADLPQPQENQ